MRNFFRKIIQKWTYSIIGFWIALKEEKSLWIFFALLPMVIGIGIWVELSLLKWAILSLIISMLISVEILNTSIEAAVDTISFQYNVKVKKIKDIASAATLIITLGSIISLLLIFIPAIKEAL
ncbi:MAG: diacylglycerol kinase [Mycoplasmatales bacterium]|nr:diacylglycerol kinase [Mycoplasmatales bacterium]